MKSYYPKTLRRVNGYLRHLIHYFEHVLHPAGGRSELSTAKNKQNHKPPRRLQASPDASNLRGGNHKKQDKKKNPAP